MGRAKESRKPKSVPKNRWDPRFLRHDVFIATAALVVCLFAGAGLLDRYLKETGPSYVAAVIAATLVDLANDDRSARALGELEVNPKLVAAAQAKADDMATKGYFAHVTPEGYDSWHWFEQAGYDYSHAGENLAVDFSESDDVEKAWMNSPTHRDNILNDEYTEIGIATAVGTYRGRPAIFAVQMFGRPTREEVLGSASKAPSIEAQATTETAVVRADGATLGEAAIIEPTQVDDDGDAAVIASENIPWWAYLIAEPKQSLRVAYYIIGILILAALVFDMELELKWHHIQHAKKAGYLLATMSMLFIAADWLFFAEPILAALGKFVQ